MVRKLMTAALVLTLALSAAGCGADKAGASASRWADNMGARAENSALSGNNAQDRRWVNEDEGGAYSADEKGRVKGFDSYDPTDPRLTQSGSDAANKAKNAAKKGTNDLKNAAKNMGSAAKNAARSVGDTAENALDELTDKT